MATDRTKLRRRFDEKKKRLDFIRSVNRGICNPAKSDRVEKALLLLEKAKQFGITTEKTKEDIKKMSGYDIGSFMRQIRTLISNAQAKS